MRHKIFFPATFVLAAFLLFACNERQAESQKAVEAKDTATRGMTVSSPLDTAPRRVNDSIYDGEHIDRYENGVIYMRGQVRGGLRHGEWLSFYRNGTLWSRGHYFNGYREGYGVSYHPNGKKSSEGYYSKNRMVGKWNFWGEDGSLVAKDFGGDTTKVVRSPAE
jgi:hypothetical protein